MMPNKALQGEFRKICFRITAPPTITMACHRAGCQLRLAALGFVARRRAYVSRLSDRSRPHDTGVGRSGVDHGSGEKQGRSLGADALRRQEQRLETLRHYPAMLMLIVFGGCGSTDRPTPASALLCSDPVDRVADPMILNSLGDEPIYQGRLYVVGEQVEFRPCGKSDIYLLVADLPIQDALYEYTSTQPTATGASVYVRFNGRQLECEGELPDRYTGVVEVNRIQARDSTVPPSCR